jgi:hypothetical protein
MNPTQALAAMGQSLWLDGGDAESVLAGFAALGIGQGSKPVLSIRGSVVQVHQREPFRERRLEPPRLCGGGASSRFK